jgi:uncharacterized protein YyaL (SSP411 family)
MLRVGWKRREPIFWVALIGFALTMQWPMLKGMYYRAAGVHGPASAIQWETSLDSALSRARQQHRLVLADFGATWCPPCLAMEHETWPDKKVASLVMDSFVPLKVDVDKNGGVAERFEVSGIPAVLLLDADGRVVRRAEGYVPASGMMQFLRGE